MLSKVHSIDPSAYITTVTAHSAIPVSTSYRVPFTMSAQAHTPSGTRAYLAYDDQDMARSLRVLGQDAGAPLLPPAAIKNLSEALDRTALGPTEVLAIISEKAQDFTNKRDVSFFYAQMILYLDDPDGTLPHKTPYWSVTIPTTEERLNFWVDAEDGTLLEERILP